MSSADWDELELAVMEMHSRQHDILQEDFASECERESEVSLLSTQEVASRLGVSAATVRERWKLGELPAYGSPGKLRFLWADVLRCFQVRPPRHREAKTVKPIRQPRGRGRVGRYKQNLREQDDQRRRAA